MTAAEIVPAGAGPEVAPAGDPLLNTIAHARGVLQADADNLRWQLDKTTAALEVLAAAVTGGHQWEIDHALHRARTILQRRKDRP